MGRAVVRMLNVGAAGLAPCSVTVCVEKLHVVGPVGRPEHASPMLVPYTGLGVSCTLYVAVSPAAGTLTLFGLTARLKSDIWAETDVWAGVMLSGEETETVPPLKIAVPPVLFGVGVSTIVTVAVEPDCNEGIVHEALIPVVPAQILPAVTLALSKVTGTEVVDVLMSSLTVMLLTRSGPWFVMM